MELLPGVNQRNIPQLRGQTETITQSLYDYQAYAAAGQTSLTFFQVPVSGTKTLADTNMSLQGMVAAGYAFNVTNIQIDFTPGGLPGEATGAQAAPTYLNDVATFAKSGYLKFTIGTKDYIVEGPMNRFPCVFGLECCVAIADQTTPAAALQTRASYARMAGPIRMVKGITIPAGLNFAVTLNWPAAVALPSGVAGRVGVILGGTLIRTAQ